MKFKPNKAIWISLSEKDLNDVVKACEEANLSFRRYVRWKLGLITKEQADEEMRLQRIREEEHKKKVSESLEQDELSQAPILTEQEKKDYLSPLLTREEAKTLLEPNSANRPLHKVPGKKAKEVEGAKSLSQEEYSKRVRNKVKQIREERQAKPKKSLSEIVKTRKTKEK